MKITLKISIIILIICGLNFRAFSQNEIAADKIYDLVNNSVVVVLAYDGNGNLYQGSGIVINNEGYVVTNYHVCKDGNRFEINHYKKEFKNIQIVKQDPDKDIMVLKVSDIPLPPIKIGSSENLKPGQRVYAIGSPEGYENSISEGIVSGVRHDSNGNELIQMTTPITEGSSGGAVVNSSGELIGMSMSGQHEGNIYFAVPIEDILTLINVDYIASTDKESENFLNEGKEASTKQNYEDAVFYFSKYLENNLNDNEAYFYRGYARMKLNDYNQAISDFTKAIEDGFDNQEVYFYRANAYYMLKDYPDAVTDYTKAIIISPELAELYYNRGYANLKSKNFGGALYDWEKAIELKPEYQKELEVKIQAIKSRK
jgi:tetratricopeptide (TPR) repeat protein